MSEDNLLRLKSDSGGMYVFDALTNNIFLIECENDFDSVSMLDLGHQSDKRQNTLDFNEIGKETTSNAKTLILEITDECNLRCTYCVFDESNQGERNHSNKTMTLDTAREAVQSFYARTNQNEGYVVFYGGEPLLAYETIKEIVSYANELSNNKLKFSLTTNGLGLSESKFDFLISNDFLITVSIDGDKNTHDKRRITKSGKGTFDAIIANLKKLQLYNDSYLKNNVIINCVISDTDDIKSINNFFDIFALPQQSLRFSPAIQNSVSIDDNILKRISLNSVKNALHTHKEITLEPVEKSFISDILKKIAFRKLDAEAKMGKKICIPFANRTYVRVDGSIQFCERIESYGKLSDKPVNLAKIADEYYREFKEFKQESCSKCHAYNFCEMCPASFIRESKFDIELANIKCNLYRNSVEQALLIYINRMENGFEAV